MHDASKSQVEEFLIEFKKIATLNKDNINFCPNEDKANLVELGLTIKQCKQLIMNLSVSDFYRGPIWDSDRDGEYWEFGIIIDGIEIFMKLKLVSYTPFSETESRKQAKCFSFHKAKYPISYPYK